MSEIDTKCLDTFPDWLRSLATDATSLSEVVGNSEASDSGRRYATAGLNYLFKSLDLIPDGIEDLGYLDDAFVLRVAAELAVADGAEEECLKALAAGASLIKDLLGDDYIRLTRYVEKLRSGHARGRTVDDIMDDEAVRRDFINEVAGWSTSYETPTFEKDSKNLVKLKSFLSAKLP